MDLTPYVPSGGQGSSASSSATLPVLSEADQRAKFVARRHKEWRDWQRTWRWLLDSLEGGKTYRDANYGYDLRGYEIRNLVRHKYEYSDPRSTPTNRQGFVGPPEMPGDDPSKFATDNDYELRRARTPVPSNFKQEVEGHLSKIFAKEVDRKGPSVVKEWWADVDGLGTTIGVWMEQTIAPLFMTIGHLDFLLDRPAAPRGAEVKTEADVEAYGLDRCVASYVLPENVPWWKLDEKGRYAQVNVIEYLDDDEGIPQKLYRCWDGMQSQLVDSHGNLVGAAIPHRYTRPPLVRIFDRRRPRCRNVGLPRYEDIADAMREIYNRLSELVLSDTLQVHCLIQGPQGVANSDSTVPMGPSWMLVKEKTTSETGAVHYEGYEVVQFPKEGAESLRLNVQAMKDDIDRSTRRTKPAGSQGTTGNTVAQSGIAKALDNRDGNLLLCQIASSLEKLETSLAAEVIRCRYNRDPTPEELASIEVVYPMSFDLLSIDELAAGCQAFQAILSQAGESPEAEILLLCKMVQELLPGLNTRSYKKIFGEIKDEVMRKATDLTARRESMAMLGADNNPVADPEQSPVQASADSNEDGSVPSPQADPSGTRYQSQATVVAPS